MRKTIITTVLFLLALASAVLGVECEDVLNVTPCNVTLTTGGIAIFNYVGVANYSNTTNNIRWGTQHENRNVTLGAGKTFYITSNDCIRPTEDYSVTTDTNLCGLNTYLLNDTNSNGAIIIGSEDLRLDCQNSIIKGNWTNAAANMRAIQAVDRNNITIRNCTITDYRFGIYTSNAENSTFEYNEVNTTKFSIYSDYPKLSIYRFNSIYNSSSSGIGFYSNNPTDGHLLIYNNTFNDSIFDMVYTNISAYNNTFYHCKPTTNFQIDINNATKSSFKDNYVVNCSTYIRINSKNIKLHNNQYYDNVYKLIAILSNSTEINFTNNKVYRSNNSLNIQDVYLSNVWVIGNEFYDHQNLAQILIRNSSHVNIYHNIIDNGSVGIFAYWNTSTIYIVNNTFKNHTSNYDAWNTPIRIELNTSNVLIENNTILDFGTEGILIRQIKDITIKGNWIDELDLTKKVNMQVNDGWEVPCGIAILELYKSYYADGTDRYDDSQNISFAWNYASYNITIDNNSFSSDTQCFLYSQGGVNVTRSFSNYWYRKLWLPVFFVNASEFYFNNAFDKIQRVQSGVIYDTFTQGHGITTYPPNTRVMYTNYSISKYIIFTMNLNETPQNHSFFNLTSNNQIFNGTSATPTATNVAKWNQTIPAGNRTLVFTYSEARQPKFTTIATTVSRVDYDYQRRSWLNITCNGTGQIVLQNMTELTANLGHYRVFHDDVFVERSTSDTYTISSCSTWKFIGADDLPGQNTCYGYTSGLTGVANTLPIVVVILMFIIALPFIIGYQTNTMDSLQDAGGTLIAVVVAIAIMVLLVIFIFAFSSNVITATC